eukprot:4373349-Pleurochrysis_carterae.AAC.1
MMVFKCVSSSAGVSTLPAFDQAIAWSLQPSPSTRMRICSFSAPALAVLLFSLASSASACAAVFQHAADSHFSK